LVVARAKRTPLSGLLKPNAAFFLFLWATNAAFSPASRDATQLFAGLY
jgi:hypothetical protein